MTPEFDQRARRNLTTGEISGLRAYKATTPNGNVVSILMGTDTARRLYARRKVLSEPTFGILKEQLAARRFLLRGLANVRAEFALLAKAFNLRTLWRAWAGWSGQPSTERSILRPAAGS